jgi:class 3 adenylate cyclase
VDYKPAPIDTFRINLSQEISELRELLAKNAHENWAKLRIEEGWHYGSERNDMRKEHPGLVPYEQLSESEKEYDRQSALETIKTLLAMGYAMQAPAGARISSDGASITLDIELAHVLQLLRDPKKPDLALLGKLWRTHDSETWSASPEIYRLFAEGILKLGEPLVAFDVVAEGIKRFPEDVRLRQLLALALARSGAAGSANAALVELYQEGHRDEETVGLLARTHKDLAAEAADASEANLHLRLAYEFYTQAYQSTGGYWSGINAATLALILGAREEAAALAGKVVEECSQKLTRIEDSKDDRYWLFSTLGEATLLLGRWSEAEDWYGQAMKVGRGDWGSLQSTRHNARLLAQHLDGGMERVDRFFRFPNVVVFSGHMVDRPDREAPRFPPQLEQEAKRAIRDRLKELNAGFGYASVACGADVLFHEAILEMKGEVHVVLPYEKDFFIKDSVDIIPGADWLARCEKIIAQAVEVQEASRRSQMGGAVSYEFANLMLHGLASVRAQQLETKLIPMVVWNGEQAIDPGGTASTVERWRKLGLSVEVIDLREILLRVRPDLIRQAGAPRGTVSIRANETPAEFASEIRALLFADAEGFSKLTDEEVPRFVHHYLGLAGELAAESPHKPLMKNTWGDGLYFVFASVGDAGLFALELRDRVRNTDWSKKGLPALSLRIGLHAGPVFSCTDPVTQRSNYIGTHVSRAARIEPVTPTGQVYASQSFAALAAAEGVKEFRCDYVGQTSMAKKYGTFPTYVVLRRYISAKGISP